MAAKTKLVDAKLRRLADGTIQALSSDGRTIYTVTIGDRESCTCPGFVHHGHCYHVTTARRTLPAFYSRPQVTPRADANLLYA